MFDGKRTYVALDLETTGLDPSDDRITEIGAVRFDEEGHELGVFDQLIDPGRPIPAFTEKLTGITNEDVKGAPAFGEIANDLAAFVGESAVVGQNVRFDLAFLAEAGRRVRRVRRWIRCGSRASSSRRDRARSRTWPPSSAWRCPSRTARWPTPGPRPACSCSCGNGRRRSPRRNARIAGARGGAGRARAGA